MKITKVGKSMEDGHFPSLEIYRPRPGRPCSAQPYAHVRAPAVPDADPDIKYSDFLRGGVGAERFWVASS
jgi:hypothetical protein